MNTPLITAWVIGWGAIALSLGSCNASFQATPKIEDRGATIERSTATEKNLPTSTINREKSPSISLVSAKSLTTEIDRKSPPSSPYINPLNSITTAAKHQITDVQPVPKVPSLPNMDLDRGKGDYARNLAVEQLEHQHQTSANRTKSNLSSTRVCPSFPCLILSQDSHIPKNRFNNPIYTLTAYQKNRSAHTFKLDAVTGRGNTQTKNRYQSNTEAPLPDGSYSVVPKVVNGTIREVGGTMVPIVPKPGFNSRMRRTALGIHWDPSFDRDPKEDGTSGCIGLTNKEDYLQVRDFILKYRPRSLEVKIAK